MKKDQQDIPEQNQSTEQEEDPTVVQPNGQPAEDQEKVDSKAKDGKEEEESEQDKLSRELEESKEKYLRLYSEFENFRRRTAKEKLELIQTANESLMVALLPVLDDFERAVKAAEDTKNEQAASEGLTLINDKLTKALEKQGLSGMKDKKGSDFDAELHEAISQFPVEQKKLKGKIVDVIEKGYKLGDKVIRFAKVVIGS